MKSVKASFVAVALAFGSGATHAKDAIELASSMHTDEVGLRLERIDTIYRLETSCQQCVLDVTVQSWVSADSPKTRREEVSLKIEQVAAIDLTAQSRADVGPIEPTGDVFELSLDEHPGYLAFDVVVLLEPTPGRMIEQRLAVFGVVGTDFKFTPLTWKMWACNSGASDCITDDNGVQYVVISSETGVQ